jgi:hypothetical protein
MKMSRMAVHFAGTYWQCCGRCRTSRKWMIDRGKVANRFKRFIGKKRIMGFIEIGVKLMNFTSLL